MTFNFDFDIAGVVISLLCLIFYLVLYANASKSSRRFTIFLILLITACSLDAITSFTIARKVMMPKILNYLLNELYYIVAGSTALAVQCYIGSVVHPENRYRPIDYLNYLVFLVYSVFCLCNYFTDHIFTIDENLVYTDNIGSISVYFIMGYFSVTSLATVCLNYKKFKMREFALLLTFILMSSLGIVLQPIAGNVLISFFISSVAAMMILLGFETPDFQQLTKTTRELEDSKAMLEAALETANTANQAKSRFLSNMSHDIRTPMNAIVGFTELALDNPADTEAVSDYLEKIQHSGNHLLALINDILDMSRIESGAVSLSPEPMKLKGLFRDVHDIEHSELLAKRLKYNEDFSGIVHDDIICDRLRLNQILLNCIGNSVKFTPAGGTINISVKESPSVQRGCGRYEFRISDTGPGISPDFLAHIFEPFEREQTSTIRKTQGTGLGMAITKNLIDMMGGSITIESEPDHGTTYIFFLTFKLCSDTISESSVAKDKKSEEYKKICEMIVGKRFLIVDDNKLNRTLAKALLAKKGVSCEEAEDGKQALDMLLSYGPGYYDLVLMDIQMPIMNGYQAADFIRTIEDPALAGIPIIAMTADAFDEDRKLCLEHKMNGHIAKPFKSDELIERLGTIFNITEEA